MKKQSKTPITDMMVKQSLANVKDPIQISETRSYEEEEKSFNALDIREQERTQHIHLLKQIKNLLLVIAQKS